VQFHSQTDQIITSQEQLEQLLLERITPEFQQSFLSPTHPLQLTPKDTGISPAQLKKAVTFIHKAIEEKQMVVIYGDYDCDGVTATAVLWEALHELGLAAQPFIPQREKHGYGLSLAALKEIVSTQKPDLLITVDNGIVAHEQVEWLKKQDIAVIITDHHEPLNTLPPANAIVHTTQLAGAGVSWILARELLGDKAQDLLDYVVLGTIADQVPLLGANRSIAWYGIHALKNSSRPSLKTLAELSGITLSSATVQTINYTFAPRINAMGRLFNAMDALRALVTRNPEKTRQLMQKLGSANEHRQDMTQDAWKQAKLLAATLNDDSVLIIQGNFHEGIIGLIASRLVDEFHKPAIVLTNSNPGTLKASCRSIIGVHITDFLRSLPQPSFLSLGGHALAAGFSLATSEYESLITNVRQLSQTITADVLEPRLDIIGPLSWQLFNQDTLNTLQKFEPFGAGNSEPLFLLSEIKVVDSKPVGKEQQHLRLNLQNEASGQSTQVICFQYQRRCPNFQNMTQAAIKLKASTYGSRTIDIELIAGQ
jgi:single-stranded-DNA-specific exonuclease